jgi:hypothetical protein
LTTIGSEELIYDLRKKIQQIQVDLNQLGDPVSEIPELISSANLLRANEYLSKANEKKTELLTIYTQYSTALEKLLSSVFDIQPVRPNPGCTSSATKSPPALRTISAAVFR